MKLSKRTINDKKIEAFLQNLYQYDWNTIKTNQGTKEAYNNFILIFCTIYDTFFPMNKIKIKTRDLESTWITKVIKKSKIFRHQFSLYKTFIIIIINRFYLTHPLYMVFVQI